MTEDSHTGFPEFDGDLNSLPLQMAGLKDSIQGALDNFLDSKEFIREISGFKTHLEGFGKRIESLGGIIELQPKKLRDVSKKLDEITTMVLDSRFKTLLEQLIQFFDLIENANKSWESIPENELAETGAKYLETMRKELIQIFLLNGISQYDAVQGEQFNPARHKFSSSQPTEDEHLDNTISSVYKPGFKSESRILRLTEVKVYKQQKTEKQEE